MKYVKLFEAYFEDKFLVFKKEFKEFIDGYMYNILDEYQFDSSEDEVFVGCEKKLIFIEVLYNHITCGDKQIEKLKPELRKIEKILGKEEIILIYSLNDLDGNYCGVWSNDIDSFLVDHHVISDFKSEGKINFSVLLKTFLHENYLTT